VWIEGVRICRVDMKKRAIQLSEPAKVIRSKIPRGIMVVPFNYKGDEKNIIATIRDKHSGL